MFECRDFLTLLNYNFKSFRACLTLIYEWPNHVWFLLKKIYIYFNTIFCRPFNTSAYLVELVPCLSSLSSASIFLSHVMFFHSFISPANIFVLLFLFTAKFSRSSLQKLLEHHPFSPVQHSPTFCLLCLFISLLPWQYCTLGLGCWSTFVHLSFRPLSHIALYKINIFPSMSSFSFSLAMLLHFHLSFFCYCFTFFVF